MAEAYPEGAELRKTKGKKGEPVSILAQLDFRSGPKGVDGFGEQIQSHKEMIQKAAQEKKLLAKKVRSFLRGPDQNGVVLCKHIMVIHFNSYCQAGPSPDQFLPSEFAIAVFSILDGLVASVGALIDPEFIPVGMRADAKEAADVLGIPMIGRHAGTGATTMAPKDVLDLINMWCEEYAMPTEDAVYFFVERDSIPVTQRCLNWLVSNENPDAVLDSLYRLIPLSELTMEITGLVVEDLDLGAGKENVMNEGSAEVIISHPQFSYCPELGCEWHSQDSNANHVEYCSKNIVQRQIYNLLAYFCFIFEIEKTEHSHSPMLRTDDIVDRELMNYLEEACARMQGTLPEDYPEDEGRIIEQE